MNAWRVCRHNVYISRVKITLLALTLRIVLTGLNDRLSWSSVGDVIKRAQDQPRKKLGFLAHT